MRTPAYRLGQLLAVAWPVAGVLLCWVHPVAGAVVLVGYVLALAAVARPKPVPPLPPLPPVPSTTAMLIELQALAAEQDPDTRPTQPMPRSLQ